MRELIAELPALTVAIPAISIALPIFSVLLLSAIFHWIFVPDKTPDETQNEKQDSLDNANAQNFSINDADVGDRFVRTPPALDFFGDNSQGDSKTSSYYKRLKRRNIPKNNNPEANASLLQTLDPDTTLDANRNGSVAMPSNASATKSLTGQGQESITPDDTKNNRPNTPDNGSHTKSANRGSAGSAKDQPSPRSEKDQRTGQQGELRVSLATAKGPAANTIQSSTLTVKNAVDTKVPVTSSLATQSTEQQTDLITTQHINNLSPGSSQQPGSDKTATTTSQNTASAKSPESTDYSTDETATSGRIAGALSPSSKTTTESFAGKRNHDALKNIPSDANQLNNSPASESPARLADQATSQNMPSIKSNQTRGLLQPSANSAYGNKANSSSNADSPSAKTVAASNANRNSDTLKNTHPAESNLNSSSAPDSQSGVTDTATALSQTAASANRATDGKTSGDTHADSPSARTAVTPATENQNNDALKNTPLAGLNKSSAAGHQPSGTTATANTQNATFAYSNKSSEKDTSKGSSPGNTNTYTPSSETTALASAENKSDSEQTNTHNNTTSDRTHQNKSADNPNASKKSTPNQLTQNQNKPGTQGAHASGNAETLESTRPKSESSRQTPVVNSATSTHNKYQHKDQPNPSNTNEQPSLQSGTKDNKNIAPTTADSATNTPSSQQQNEAAAKQHNSQANGPSRSPVRPKYQNAAKARYIPSSIEAQLQLKAPGTSKANNDENDTASRAASNDIADTKLLAEKDRLIEELEAKLRAFQQQAHNQNSSDQNNGIPSSISDPAIAASSAKTTGQIDNPASLANQSTTVALRNAVQASSKAESDKTSGKAAIIPGGNNAADQSLASQNQNTQKKSSPAHLLASVNTTTTDAQQIQFKRRYEEASEKLTLNENKIQKLQSTVNRLQASGLVELQNQPQVPHSRKTLLSKVRVLAPAE